MWAWRKICGFGIESSLELALKSQKSETCVLLGLGSITGFRKDADYQTTFYQFSNFSIVRYGIFCQFWGHSTARGQQWEDDDYRECPVG
ncbi:hypothetical protein Leryth_017663 [Lithospermum erythrorhizon]|nr:hypothetical protein Leryth_017663 [Lithospermum erythrorhizon]